MVVKKLFILLFTISTFSQEIPIIDFTLGDYPINKKLKIGFNSQGNYTMDLDSISDYTIIKFKEKNIPEGEVITYFSSGEVKSRILFDFYSNDSTSINGPYTTYHKNGNIYESGFLLNNKLYGPYTENYESGTTKFLLNYVNGLAQGKYTSYHESGAVSSTGNYLNDLAEGKWTFYFDSGNKELLGTVQEIGMYKDGLLDGEYFYYYYENEDDLSVSDLKAEGGELKFIFLYKNDTILSEKQFDLSKNVIYENKNYSTNNDAIFYYPSGSVRSITPQSNGKSNGVEKVFFDNTDNIWKKVTWLDGTRNGKYETYYESGAVEEIGMYKDDLLQGEVLSYYDSGTIDEKGPLQSKGSYVNGLSEGKYEIYYESGAVEEIGMYKDDLLHGEVSAYYDSGTKDEKGILRAKVNYINGLQEGKFEIYYESGAVMKISIYKDGLVQGEFLEFYDSGSIDEIGTTKIIGNYVNDLYEGKWTFYYESGAIMQIGNYENNLAEGKYTHYFESGAISQIQNYVNGLVQGETIHYYDSGSAERLGNINEITSMVDGKIDGTFVSYFESGNFRQSGTYNNDLQDGKFVYYYENGKVQGSGIYKNGLMEGEWTYGYENGIRKKKENYIAGKLNGTYEIYYESSGAVQEIGIYKDDFNNGEVLTYYDSGSEGEKGPLESKANYVNDLIEGKVETYYESSGAVQQIMMYKDGLIQGEYLVFYDSGSEGEKGPLQSKSNCVNDLFEGKYETYYESGAVEEIGMYKDDLLQGEVLAYYDSGSEGEKGPLLSKANYVNDLFEGKFETYYESGAVEKIMMYKDGLVQGEYLVFYDSGSEGEKGPLQAKGNCVNDLFEGKYTFYFESGAIEQIRSYVNDEFNGEYEIYYDSGIKDVMGPIREKGNAVNGYVDGRVEYYKRNGQIDYYELWEDGNQIERRIALVIGNENYIDNPLKNPVNDANLIAESLEKLNFEVLKYTNLETEKEMEAAIKDFGLKRKNYEIAFIYYAGHAIQIDNKNFLLPTMEEYNDQYDLKQNAVSLQTILQFLEYARDEQLNFLVLDACRDNRYEKRISLSRSGGGGSGLAKVSPPSGSLIAFSTNAGETADDNQDGDNSIYTQVLAEKMLEENVSIEQVFKNVRTDVQMITKDMGRYQSPVEENKLVGDVFYLNPTYVEE